MLLGIHPNKHGSFEDFAIHICREISNRGYIPHIAFPTVPPDWFEKNLHKAGGILAPTRLVTKPWAPGSLLKYLSAENIHILHLHLVHTMAAWLWKKITGFPLVLTLHVGKDYNSRHWLGIAAALRARLIYRASKIIAISGYIQKFALGLDFNLLPDNIIQIYNGVDINRFCPRLDKTSLRQQLNWKADKIVLLSITHLRKDKGLELLIRAFSKAARVHGNIILAIVGDGPDLNNLKDLTKQLEITDRVKWLGQRNDTEKLMGSADIFILTPIWEEPFGYVFAEASSCGLPVIATNSGGIPEIVENGKTGIILEKNDITGISSAMCKLADNDDLRKQMGQKGRKRIEKYFDIKMQVRQIVDLYEHEIKSAILNS